MSDLEQAIDRLSYAVLNEENRKVVFLTGSGISSPQVPGTQAMVDVFLEQLNATTAESLRKKVAGRTPSEQYTTVAEELQRRRGDIGLASAIGKGVARALKEPLRSSAPNMDTVTDSDWNLPEAQNLLGKLVSKIPPQQVGAVITTNFDSLTEVAFRLHGVAATPLAVPGSTAFPIDAVCGPLPIVHLHGYWGNSATLSTAVQLDTERPNIERMITHLLDGAMLVVLGYGGWNDSFTRALIQMVRDGHTTSLKTEIMWLKHGKADAVTSHPLLREISGHAGVNIYSDINADEFLAGVLDVIGTVDRKPLRSYLGWTPVLESYSAPKLSELRSYVEGGQPDWCIAQEMPMLSNAQILYDAVRAACADNLYENIVVSAPAGEGKTTALLQVSRALASKTDDVTILYRNAGAPRVTSEWLDLLAEENALSVLFVDDADLVISQIYFANLNRRTEFAGRIIWVLAFHPSYLQSSKVSVKLPKSTSRTIEFSPFSSDDAEQLALSWQQHNLLPSEFRKRSADDIAHMVLDAGDSIQGRSLFGSVLHLWGGDDLEARVEHMLAKVSNLAIAGVSFRHLISAVAVTQVVWDEYAVSGEGLSLAALGFIAKTTNQDIVRLVVEPLGREVGISRIGDRVYMRHPSIARAIYDILSEGDELSGILRELAYQGCKMRYAKRYYNEDYHSIYMLSRQLKGPEALAASAGAVHAAPKRLEPRVTAIATLRESGQLKTAQSYAAKLAKRVHDYEDYLQTQRGFFVEWSVVESKLEHHEQALSIAIQAIADQVPGFLSVDKLEYGLVSIIRSAKRLTEANVPGADAVLDASRRVLYRLPAGKSDFWHLALQDDQSSVLELIGQFRRGAVMFAPAGASFVKMQSTLAVEHGGPR